MPQDHRSITEFGLAADAPGVHTAAIQAAIDACAGGTLRFPAGTWRSGSLRLRSHLTIQLDAGAVLQGSADIADYDKRYWGGGFLIGKDLDGVAITGAGTIDGADCRDPAGEEGFRGPHCIALTGCRGIRIQGITVIRSANWAFNCVECRDAVFEGLRIRGGHDGVDAMWCQGFAFRDCDFRTGDDCIAGSDNRDFSFTGCHFNTSCNAFRFACLGLRVTASRFQGPGEFRHQVTGKNSMLTAFIHFSPPDRRNCQGLQPQSDDWLIEDCVVDGVEQLYEFDHRALWQNGRPVRQVTFREVTARTLREPVFVVGDIRRQFILVLDRVTLELPAGSWFHHPFIDLRSFDAVQLKGVVCIGVDGSHPALSTVDGLRVDVDALRCETARQPAGPIARP